MSGCGSSAGWADSGVPTALLMPVAMLALALQQVPAAPPPAASEGTADDIVVAAQRLGRMRLSVRYDRKGQVTCRVRRSSGDAATDALACAASRECAGSSVPRKADAQTCVRDRLVARLGIPPSSVFY
jgi:hypothetical protein